MSQAPLSLSVAELLGLTREQLAQQLRAVYEGDGVDVSPQQLGVWCIEHDVLRELLQQATVAQAVARVVFEFRRPGEGLRRVADVLLLLRSGAIAVLEFKHKRPDEYDERQAIADALHLQNCHAASHDREVRPFLLITKPACTIPASFRDVLAVEAIESGFPALTRYLAAGACDEDCSAWQDWLLAPYHIKPSLLRGTVLAIQRGEIPELCGDDGEQLRQAREWIIERHRLAQEQRRGLVIVVDGVPGAGKTLLGVSLVAELHQNQQQHCASLFSGNAPLIAVLQAALRQRGATTDQLFRHAKHIKPQLKQGAALAESLLVFDEAQRAWLAQNAELSELALFWQWAQQQRKTLVLLVGKGQAIHTKEMPDGAFWDALRGLAVPQDVDVYCSEQAAQHHQLQPTETVPLLRLSNPIRQHGIERFAQWVDAVLSNQADRACALAEAIQPYYALRVFADSSDAEASAREAQARQGNGDPRFRLGWFVSSNAGSAVPPGKPRLVAKQEGPVGDWYVKPSDHRASCCALSCCSTEFTCQGLEVDIALLAWGQDFSHQGNAWTVRPGLRDCDEFTVNAYRVLLTRGRTALFIYCLDPQTREYLQRCGMILASTSAAPPIQEQSDDEYTCRA